MTKVKKRGFWRRNAQFIVIFLIGLAVLLYPQVSRLYYTFEATSQVQIFQKDKSALANEELAKRRDLAEAFNASLHNHISVDPYSEDKKASGRAEYARMLEVHEQMGHVEVPSIGLDLPVYAGTVEEVISKGSGHLEGTSLPIGGTNSHAVLTSHAGLPTAKLFTDLKEVKEGDIFYVHNIFETLAYEVDQIKVIEPTDFSDLTVVEGQDYVTLLTCTPPIVNTHRLLVRGHRIPFDDQVYQSINKHQRPYLTYAFIGLALLFGFILLWLLWRQRQKDDKDQMTKEAPNA